MESRPLRPDDSVCAACCSWTLRAFLDGLGVVGRTTGAGGPIPAPPPLAGAAKAAPDGAKEDRLLPDVLSSICFGAGLALHEPRLAMDTSPSSTSSSSGRATAVVRCGSNQGGSVILLGVMKAEDTAGTAVVMKASRNAVFFALYLAGRRVINLNHL